MKYLLIFLIVSCATAVPVVNLAKEIKMISEDQSIPAETKKKVIDSLLDKQTESINVVVKRSEEMNKKIEQDSWKVSLVNTILWIIGILVASALLYFLFKFRKLFGSPI